MKLYFARHGQSEANTQHIISNRDVPLGLTALGRQQAHALAERLKDVRFRAIYSSPVFRARETAEILSASLGMPCQVTEALREYDCGILENQSDEASWKLHREFFEAWTLSHDWECKPEGGESFLEIRNRFVPFVEGLLQNSSRGDSILLIGHGGLFHLMLPVLLRNIDDEFVRSHGMGNTDYVLAEQENDGLVCRQWCQVEFSTSRPKRR